MFSKSSFSKIIAATVLSLPIVALNVHSASAEERVFNVHNESSMDIEYLFVSNSGDEKWGKDVLGDNVVMERGEMGTITVTTDSDACLYDIKAVAADGKTSAELYQVNLCENQEVTFFDTQE